jgi:DNA sulfur modification protein DndC
MSSRIEHILNEITDQYLLDDGARPWIIGFSGGKDSTVLLQLVWKALVDLGDIKGISPRDIYVVCNDTMVENPIITNYVNKVLDQIQNAAVRESINIQVHKTVPRLEDSFWLNIIGKGYPVPNNAFRWCTEKLKIKPTSRFVVDQIDEKGEAIVLVGTRSDESQSRARSIKKHDIRGKRLSKHSNLRNAYIYSPIKHLRLEEIWHVINTMPSPWGANNEELFKIYADASADDYECPTMVSNKTHSSCGNSRFGCWTCTVVKKDKSMSSLVDNGFAWMTPLLKFRNELVEGRNIKANRSKKRRNGTDAINEMGSYKAKYRAEILKNLLLTQKEIQQSHPDVELITNQEMVAIQVTWYRDFIFQYKVSKIYNEIYSKDLDMNKQDENFRKEEELLREVCDTEDQFSLIQDHLALSKNKALLTRKRGLKDDLERRINKLIEKK